MMRLLFRICKNEKITIFSFVIDCVKDNLFNYYNHYLSDEDAFRTVRTHTAQYINYLLHYLIDEKFETLEIKIENQIVIIEFSGLNNIYTETLGIKSYKELKKRIYVITENKKVVKLLHNNVNIDLNVDYMPNSVRISVIK